jgi:hypothetical protein
MKIPNDKIEDIIDLSVDRHMSLHVDWIMYSCILAMSRRHRLVDKYMPQPRLMKLNRTNIDENYLSSDVVSIALPCLALPCLTS